MRKSTNSRQYPNNVRAGRIGNKADLWTRSAPALLTCGESSSRCSLLSNGVRRVAEGRSCSFPTRAWPNRDVAAIRPCSHVFHRRQLPSRRSRAGWLWREEQRLDSSCNTPDALAVPYICLSGDDGRGLHTSENKIMALGGPSPPRCQKGKAPQLLSRPGGARNNDFLTHAHRLGLCETRLQGARFRSIAGASQAFPVSIQRRLLLRVEHLFYSFVHLLKELGCSASLALGVESRGLEQTPGFEPQQCEY